MTLEQAKTKAMNNSKEGYVQHVNEDYPGVYVVSDWYDYETTRASYFNGRDTDE